MTLTEGAEADSEGEMADFEIFIWFSFFFFFLFVLRREEACKRREGAGGLRLTSMEKGEGEEKAETLSTA